MSPDALTPDQRAALLAALRPFADVVRRVDLYGSRARRDHRPGSDIDLIVDGAHDDDIFATIATALDDCPLSVGVSVMRYDDVADTPLNVTIARDATPLFHQSDLR